MLLITKNVILQKYLELTIRELHFKGFLTTEYFIRGRTSIFLCNYFARVKQYHFKYLREEHFQINLHNVLFQNIDLKIYLNLCLVLFWTRFVVKCCFLYIKKILSCYFTRIKQLLFNKKDHAQKDNVDILSVIFRLYRRQNCCNLFCFLI